MRSLDIIDPNNDEGVSCTQRWAQSQLADTSGSLPDTVGPNYYEEIGFAELQIGRITKQLEAVEHGISQQGRAGEPCAVAE